MMHTFNSFLWRLKRSGLSIEISPDPSACGLALDAAGSTASEQGLPYPACKRFFAVDSLAPPDSVLQEAPWLGGGGFFPQGLSIYKIGLLPKGKGQGMTLYSYFLSLYVAPCVLELGAFQGISTCSIGARSASPIMESMLRNYQCSLSK